MKTKIAYQTEDYRSGVTEIDFDLSDWRDDISLEEANTVQVEIYIREAIYEETGENRRITQFVVLDGELKDWLQDNHKDPLTKQ